MRWSARRRQRSGSRAAGVTVLRGSKACLSRDERLCPAGAFSTPSAPGNRYQMIVDMSRAFTFWPRRPSPRDAQCRPTGTDLTGTGLPGRAGRSRRGHGHARDTAVTNARHCDLRGGAAPASRVPGDGSAVAQACGAKARGPWDMRLSYEARSVSPVARISCSSAAATSPASPRDSPSTMRRCWACATAALPVSSVR